MDVTGNSDLKPVSEMDLFTTATAPICFYEFVDREEEKEYESAETSGTTAVQERSNYGAQGLLSDLKFQEVSGQSDTLSLRILSKY